MNRPRVAVLAHSYWPSGSDASLRLRAWLTEASKAGFDSEIFTARWHRSWPARIIVDGTPVQRIDNPPTSALYNRRYARQVLQTVAENRSNWDLIYCDRLDYAATTIVTNLSNSERPPLVLRYRQSYATRSGSLPRRSLDTLRSCERIIASSASDHRHLLSLGIAENRIIRQPDCIASQVQRDDRSRRTARQILRNANYDLNVKGSNRIVLCPSQFLSSEDAKAIAAAYRFIDEHEPVRIWLVGDGPARPQVSDCLRHAGIHRSVITPGVFSSPTELLQAADALLIPPSLEGIHWFLPTAISSGLAIMLPRETTRFFAPEFSALLSPGFYDPASTTELDSLLRSWQASPAVLTSITSKARALLPQRINFDPLKSLIH